MSCTETITKQKLDYSFLTKEYDVKSYETNMHKEIKPYVFLRYLEDMAYLHAEEIGIGYSRLSPENLTWFLTKYHLRFNKMPFAWDKIKIKTWPSLNSGIQCRREFEITQNNELIAQVSSTWVVVDLGTKRLLNAFKTLDFPPLPAKYALDTKFEKFGAIEKVSFEKVFDVEFDDIDMNNHVNNTNYLKWAINTLPTSFLENNSLKEARMFYKKEATLGMSIKSQVERNGVINSTQHSILNAETGDELVGIKLFWNKHN